jgi:hypothetical protein
VPPPPPAPGTAARESAPFRFPRTPVDQRLAAAIRAGGGVATASALREAGVHRDAVRRRLAAGILTEVHEHVYAFPQDELLPLTRRRAAVLSCGDDAALSHWPCADHFGLLTFVEAPDRRMHVTVPRARNPRRRDIVVHRVALAAEDLVTHDGVLCTALPRLLLDLAAQTRRRTLERLVDEAAYLGRWRRWDLEALLDRVGDRAGAATLASILAEHVPGTTRTTNELEEAFLAICDANGWPRPICQVPDTLSNGRRIAHDFVWRHLRLIVETDGGRGHDGRKRKGRDRHRDALLEAAGWRVIRISWWQVFERPHDVVTRLRPLFA